MEWLATYEGRIFGLWLAIRRDDSVSLEWVRDRVIEESEKAEATGSYGAELWWDGIQSSLDTANGDDELSALENFGIEEAKGKSRHPNWRLAFRDLCLSYPNNESVCLSPDQFWNLTLGQYRQLTRTRESLAGVTYSRGSEMDAHCQRMNKATESAIDNLTGGKRWNAK
jgi:hypothetical protein